MFYPVRVFNQKGKLKKKIPAKTLSEKYWDNFYNSVQKNIQITSKKGRKKQSFWKTGYDSNFFSEE
ncbi:MAG: hypothetical protein E2O44_02025 [Nitrospina sp.]|nr:MAG: hypothetical protein E2O44_02025 [Nitrospina sp.]